MQGFIRLSNNKILNINQIKTILIEVLGNENQKHNVVMYDTDNNKTSFKVCDTREEAQEIFEKIAKQLSPVNLDVTNSFSYDNI